MLYISCGKEGASQRGVWERGRISTRSVGKRAHLNAGWPAPGCETVPGCGASSSTRGQLREQLKLRKSLRAGDKSTSLHDFTTGRPAPCTHYAHLQCRRRMCMHRHASPPHSCMRRMITCTQRRALAFLACGRAEDGWRRHASDEAALVTPA